MNLYKKITAITIFLLTLIISTALVNGASTENYTVGNGNITIISKTADGTILETKTPYLTPGDMAKLSAKTTVTNNGVTYSFSHFEYHTSARDYVASYDNPMDLYVDPPITIYAVYTNGTNTTAYVANGTTGFYKDPVTDGTNTYLFCSIAGTSNLASEEVKAVLSAAGSIAVEGSTMETVTIENNSSTSTTKLFSKQVKSMQFIVAVPLTSAINAEILSTNYNTNKGQTKTWDFGTEAFSNLSSGGNNVNINNLTFSRIPGSCYKEETITVNGTNYTRGIKQDTGKTISFSATKGDIIEIYGKGNSGDSTLSVNNASLLSGTGTMLRDGGSVNTYVAETTDNITISLTGKNGYIYCIKVNSFNPVAIEPPSVTTTKEQSTETTTVVTTQTTTKETSSETTTEEESVEPTTETPVPSGDIWYKRWVNNGDVPADEINDSSFFSGVSTGTNKTTVTFTIDKQYTTQYRTGSNSPEITFTVPSGYSGTFYIVATSSGSSGRDLTLSTTNSSEYSKTITSNNSSSGFGLITFTDLVSGNYSLEASGNIQYCFVAANLVNVVDPTKGNINATVKNLNGSTVFDAVVTATLNGKSTQLGYNSSKSMYIATNIEPGTYTITATKTINGTDFTANTTAEVKANETALPTLTLNYGTGNIIVIVKNTENIAIANANVTAKNTNGDTITLKYDQSENVYTANDVFAANYIITAEKDGTTNTANVTVTQGQTVTSEIVLDIDPNAYLYVDVQDQLSQPFNTTDTTTVTNNAELVAALNKYNASSTGGTIYIDAPIIECEQQLRITGTNISLIGVVQEELSTAKYKVFPVLDFSKFRASEAGINAANPLALTKGSDTDAGIRINGNYNLIQNLIVEKAPDNGIQLKANDDLPENADQIACHNIIENCIARYNNDTGIQVSAPMPLKGTDYIAKASYNTFKWCYSYRNCDVYTFGGNADGFAPKLNTRTSNKFINCYAWDNSDDGWDAFDKSAASNTNEKNQECDADVTADIEYEECACWNNGNREVFSGVYDVSKGYPVDTNLFVYELLSSQNVGYNGTNFAEVAGKASIMANNTVVTWSSWYSTANSEMNGNGFKFGSADTPKATSWTDSNGTTYEMKRVLKNCLAFDHKSKGFDNNNTSGINGYFTNTVGFDNKYNYYFSGYKLPVWTNILSFSGSSKDSLPSGFTASTPTSAEQTAIRAEVDDKSKKIFEACQANVIPGAAKFNIYN